MIIMMREDPLTLYIYQDIEETKITNKYKYSFEGHLSQDSNPRINSDPENLGKVGDSCLLIPLFIIHTQTPNNFPHIK